MANVLVQCGAAVGTSMAGAAIRCWEISAQLAREHDVTLASPAPARDGAGPPGVRVVALPLTASPAAYRGYDAVVAPAVRPPLALAKRRHGFRLVADLYDPVTVEALELLANLPLADQRRALARQRSDLDLALRTADHVICASDVQRDMWIGALTTAGRLDPAAYAADPTLRRLIDVVPFGVSTEPRVRGGAGPRARFGLAVGDLVLLWGGGIWDWLDPLTLIDAVADAAATHPATRLVFMGGGHAGEGAGEMAMAARARRRAADLELTGRHVFFHDGWVPYAERGDWLLDADAGVSIHRDHLETRFAYRTRNLDYLWAGLPVLASAGDVFAPLLQQARAGVVVPPGDRAALAAAIRALHDPELRRRLGHASRALGERQAWPVVVAPLLEMLRERGAPLRPPVARLTGATARMAADAARNRLRALVGAR